MKRAPLTIISHFYNHHERVQQQLNRWKLFPRNVLENVEFLLIDDCSSSKAELDLNGLNIRLYIIKTDIRWNQSGARNLATLLANSDWALYFDIDQLLTEEALPIILANISSLDPNNLYHLAIQKLWNTIDNVKSDFHPASFLSNITRMKEIGMWDEDFAGHYGYEDIYLPMMWEHNGGKRVFLSSPYFFAENLDFHTENLDRDLEHNKGTMMAKINVLQNSANQIIRPRNILRFDYYKFNY